MTQRMWRASLMVAVMAGVVACSTPGPVKVYEGAMRPSAEVALVSVPEEIEVMAIDGREPPPSFLKSKVQLAVLPGEHVFSLRYVELFQLNADEHDVVRSRQAALRFTASAGHEYGLQMPRQANNEAAKKFAKDPKFTLVSIGDGSSVESTPIKSYAEASLIDTITKSFETAGTEDANRQVTNLDMLKDIWGRASQDERSRFRLWLDEQGK